MIAHIVVCDHASEGQQGDVEHGVRLLHDQISRAGLARFAVGGFEGFSARLSDQQRLRWSLLHEMGLVVENGSVDIDECPDLSSIRGSFPNDDLIVCSDGKARRLGLGAALRAAGRPEVAGLGGAAASEAVVAASESQPGVLEDGEDSSHHLESEAVRRVLRFASSICLVDQYLLKDDWAKSGARRVVEAQSSVQPAVSRGRQLTLITCHPDSTKDVDRSHVPRPTAAAAMTWLRALGLDPVPPNVATVQLYLRPFAQTSRWMHDRQLRLGGRVFDIGRGAARLSDRAAVPPRSTFHIGNTLSFRVLEDDQTAAAEWCISFEDGEWLVRDRRGAEESLR